jgi:hypothetical protein
MGRHNRKVDGSSQVAYGRGTLEAERLSCTNGDKTQRGAIVFLNYHETYHVGQMAYLRKWLGYSQLVG